MLPFAMRWTPISARWLPIVHRSPLQSNLSAALAATFPRPRSVSAHIRPLFSYSYKSLFLQTLCIHIYTKRPGCRPLDNPNNVASQSVPPSRESTPFVSITCSRFGVLQKVIRRIFNHLHTLLAKCHGWGYLPAFRRILRAYQPLKPFATWTASPHPTIIAVMPRSQVHG